MKENIFLKPFDWYKRELNPMKDYIRQGAFYMSKMSGKSMDECVRLLVSKIKNKELSGLRNPRVNYFQRDDNADRHQVSGTLNGYLASIVKNKEIMAPTLTTYVRPEVRESLLVGFFESNKIKRAQFKREASAARAAGDTQLYIAKNNAQNNMKTYNNSGSGTFSAGGNVLTNPTGHNTLTTVVRTMSSISNSSNEKIISGNRHYYNAEVTLNNINYIASGADKELLKKVITKYNLTIPTVEDVKECVLWSTQLYMVGDYSLKEVWKLVEKLDDYERAAVVYGGDLYHLRKHNDQFIRTFVTELSYKPSGKHYENPLEKIYSFDPMVINYAHQVCRKEMMGKGNDYQSLEQKDLCTVIAVCENITSVIQKYKDFIEAFFLTRNIPASTAYIRNMVRRTVVLSDTDSTMFSVDEWVKWYYGDIIFTDESFAVSGSIMYIATQCMAHNLAIMSANMGVPEDKLFECKMEPELVFGLHFQTPVAKHYFCPINIREGSVFEEPDMEIKGVHLINSAVSREILKGTHERMRWLTDEIMKGNKISIKESLKRLADIERTIIKGIYSGKVEYYKTSQIKNAEAYSGGADSPNYRHYLHWKEVWAPKYGDPGLPPYGTLSIPIDLTNKTKLYGWVDQIKDPELRERERKWLLRHNRTDLKTFMMPYDIIASNGLPVELQDAVNVRKLVIDGTRAERMVLATLGYHIKEDWLVSELGF